MARDNSMMTSPWANSGSFFKDALDRAMPGDSMPKPKVKEPTLDELIMPKIEKTAAPMNEEKQNLFNEMISMLQQYGGATLEIADFKNGTAIFETEGKFKIRLEML